MKEGCYAILGYGVVFSVEEFLKIFPHSFQNWTEKGDYNPYKRTETTPQYLPEDDVIEEIEGKWGISIHVEKQSPTDKLFVTDQNYICLETHNGAHMEVTPEDLKSNLKSLEKFIDFCNIIKGEQNCPCQFPSIEIKLIMFTYKELF